MHDLQRVRLGEPGGYFGQDVADLRQRQGAGAAGELVEAVALDQLHGDEDPAGDAAEIEDAHDVRVGEPPADLRLAQQPLLLAGIVVVAQQRLDRHHLVELAVAGAEDPAHPAAADLGLDLVTSGEHAPGSELRQRRSTLVASGCRRSRDTGRHLGRRLGDRGSCARRRGAGRRSAQRGEPSLGVLEPWIHADHLHVAEESLRLFLPALVIRPCQ